MRLSNQTKLLIAVACVALLSGSAFVVHESERAIVTRLGQFVEDRSGHARLSHPGLHFKWPWIEKALLFDHRLNLSQIPTARIVTREKKDLFVDLFVQWRIKDCATFYTATTRFERAEELIQHKVIDAVRAEFGQRDIRNVVSDERKEMMEKLKTGVDASLSQYGIQVVDVRIKRADLPQEVSDAVFERMRTERKRVASEYRATGEAEAEKIRARADKSARTTLAAALKEAQTIRGEGDAAANTLYARAYNKAPKFFDFYRSLAAYQKAFGSNPAKRDLWVLKSDQGFLTYFDKLTLQKEAKE